MARSHDAEALGTSRPAAVSVSTDNVQTNNPGTTGSAKASSPLRAWAIRIVGTLVFVALILWLDSTGALSLEDVWATLARANVWLVALSIAMYVPFLVVKALRWRKVAADMQMPFPWSDAWRIYAIGLAAGTFTPGQAGDAVKAIYLGQMGYPIGRAVGSSIFDRLFDVAALAILGLVGVTVYGGLFAGQVPALVALAIACSVMVGFFAWSRTREWAFGFVARRLSKPGAGDQDASAIDEKRPWSLTKETFLYAALLTVASFVISTFRVWLLAGALGVWLGLLEVMGFVGLTTAAALVPVTLGGIGTRDVVAALAFVQLGRPAAEGVAVSALILVLNLAQAVIGWVVWLRYRVSVTASQSS